MPYLRRLFAMLAVAVLVLSLAAPAAAWSISLCEFSGTNWMTGGNTAWAKTTDDNGWCSTLWVKVKYKVDGQWYISPPQSINNSSITIGHVGADDSGGAHKAKSLITHYVSGYYYS